MVMGPSKDSPIVKLRFQSLGPDRFRGRCPTRESDWETEDEEELSDMRCGYEPDNESGNDLDGRLVHIEIKYTAHYICMLFPILWKVPIQIVDTRYEMCTRVGHQHQQVLDSQECRLFIFLRHPVYNI